MTRKVKGILLRIGQTVHEERVLTILAEQGCVTVFAKSSRKKNQYDQFYYGEWVLYETGSGNYLLNSFSLEEPFHELKEQMENTFLAGYLAQIVLYFAKFAPQETGVLLSLLLNSLYLLGRGKPPRLVKSVFELKTMQLMGYCPTLASCGHPGSIFSLEDGSILCEECGLSVKGVPVTASVAAALTHILNHPPAKAFGFQIPRPELLRLSRLSEEFLLYHLEIRASALEMWKTVHEDKE
ncbi:MAG: DNA repair protein RecO [Clostridia bacterium]|nr:DNA repair protein RecO [Clostridia bacterium]